MSDQEVPLPREPRLPSLSGKEAVILDLLIAGRELYGLELVEASGGRIKRGTVYVTLSRLEAKGYVESRPDPSQPGVELPRRLYRATVRGRSLFRLLTSVQRKLDPEPAR